jgi:hypothetical protein
MGVVRGRQGAGKHGRERIHITIAERAVGRKEKADHHDDGDKHDHGHHQHDD